jgi:RHS repeat-associated protein
MDYYENFTANGTLGTTAMIAGIAGAFGGVSGGTEGQQLIFDAVDAALGLFGLLGDNNSTEPQAYLNYILFDEAMQPADFGFAGVSTNANLAHELLQLQVSVDKPGYLFIYTSNESNSTDPVYFDDLKVTLHPGKVDAAYDYYPFGLPTEESWERVTAPVTDRWYQGMYASMEKETNLYRFKSRMFDAAIGRWLSTDPANQYNSPYAGMGNKPIAGVDPEGTIFWDNFIIGGIIGVLGGGDFYKNGNRTVQRSLLITGGLFQGDFKQIVSRFAWEGRQTGFGFATAYLTNMVGLVSDVNYFDGATVISSKANRDGAAFTMGSYITGDEDFKPDFRDHLFVHEYGHYIQSQRIGPLYKPLVMKPSLKDIIIFPDNHDPRWYEADASLFAGRYFDRNYGRGLNGYSKGSDKYFDRESFHSGGRTPYRNPRTNSFDQESSTTNKDFHWSDLVINLFNGFIGLLGFF